MNIRLFIFSIFSTFAIISAEPVFITQLNTFVQNIAREYGMSDWQIEVTIHHDINYAGALVTSFKKGLIVIGPECAKLFKTEPKQLRAIIGHELSHLLHYDGFKGALITNLMGTIKNTMSIYTGYITYKKASKSRYKSRLLRVAAGLSAFLLSRYILDKLNSVIFAQINQKIEKRADSESAKILGTRDELIAFLNKMLQKEKSSPSPTFIQRLFDSHPPAEDRIDNLRAST